MKSMLFLLAGLLLLGACDDMTDQPKQKTYSPDVGPAKVPAGLVGLFDYAWFVGFALAFVIYLVLRKLAPKL